MLKKQFLGELAKGLEGFFSATGDLPNFYHEFKEKGLEVPESTFKRIG